METLALLYVVDETTEQKIITDTGELNNSIKQLDLLSLEHSSRMPMDQQQQSTHSFQNFYQDRLYSGPKNKSEQNLKNRKQAKYIMWQ